MAKLPFQRIRFSHTPVGGEGLVKKMELIHLCFNLHLNVFKEVDSVFTSLLSTYMSFTFLFFYMKEVLFDEAYA